MKERRKKLLLALQRKKGSVEDLDKQEDRKRLLIKGFSPHQLEEMLKATTRNVAQEVVNCLMDEENKGLLSEIIKWMSNDNHLNSYGELCSEGVDITVPIIEDEDGDAPISKTEDKRDTQTDIFRTLNTAAKIF